MDALLQLSSISPLGFYISSGSCGYCESNQRKLLLQLEKRRRELQAKKAQDVQDDLLCETHNVKSASAADAISSNSIVAAELPATDKQQSHQSQGITSSTAGSASEQQKLTDVENVDHDTSNEQSPAQVLSAAAPTGQNTSSIANGITGGEASSTENEEDVDGEKQSSQSPSVVSSDSRASFYARARVLQPEHYQLLLDRGWRRSGTLLYKPDMRHSCCPHYTIRLPVGSFRARRDQRSACHRWNRFVLGDDYVKQAARLHPKSKADKARERGEFSLVHAIHEVEFDHLPPEPRPAHKFEVTLEPAAFSQEKYEVYKNYQQHVHGEDESKATAHGFRRFLCDSPLVSKTRIVNGKEQRLGSFHQCYRLDGRLIALGVLDLLPHCVSGVYFLYHSDYERFSFGKMSALREACLALEEQYQYYYMGYYIHSCDKMRYKNDYSPQYFLDLESHDWEPLDATTLALMDKHHYLSFQNVRAAEKVDLLTESHGKVGKAAERDPTFNKRLGQSAVTAMTSAHDGGRSLFDMHFAGMMTVSQLTASVDLDHMLIRLRNGVYHCENLQGWDEGSVEDPLCLKGMMAELVANAGEEFAKVMILDLN